MNWADGHVEGAQMVHKHPLQRLEFWDFLYESECPCLDDIRINEVATRCKVICQITNG